MHGTDYSIVSGCFGNRQVAGFDLAGQVGTAGIRGEFTQVRVRTGPTYQRAVLALDYMLANTFTPSTELYYNGAGTTSAAAYGSASLLIGETRSIAKHYANGYMSYEITLLPKQEGYVVVNLDDHSHFVLPLLTYPVETNFDQQISTQLFMGSSGSEFRYFHHIYYAQIQ